MMRSRGGISGTDKINMIILDGKKHLMILDEIASEVKSIISVGGKAPHYLLF